MEQSSKVPESLPEKKPPMAKLQQRLLLRCFLSASDGHEEQRLCVAAEALGRASVGMGAVYFRSRIPAMALT